ncbi:sensor histidine kinase [Paenibacillaceae bacterium WGS1546]|uniref:cache domain-containing sensor histidine kinase n=1 Tax=Cohnella sp. WGS1546 TaxID=3366810 RepID=UPI00372D36BB
MIANLARKALHRLLDRKSIQFQLFLTFMIINLVPIVVIGYFTFRVSSATISEEVKNSNEQLMGEIVSNYELYFRNIEIDANKFASQMVNNNIRLNEKVYFFDTFIVENIMEINDYLHSTFEATGNFLGIRVFSDNGHFISSAFNQETYEVNSYNSEEDLAWREAMRNNRENKLIFDVHPLNREGLLSLVASKPVINPFSGKRMGYISFDKEMDSFAALFQPFEQRAGSTIQLVSKEGKILYHTNRGLIGTKADPDWLARVTASFDASHREAETIDKDHMVLASQMPNQEAYMISSVPLSLINSQVESIRNLTISVMLLSVVLVFGLSFFLSIYISKPIKQLSKAMQQVERGRLNAHIPLKESNLETWQLAKSFESMLARINELVKTQYEMELHKKDAELKALMMQINPHFLYNTLEVISGLADYEQVSQISEITQSLSRMLRYNIDLKTEEVRLAEEIDNCSHFFLILKSRFGDKLQVEQRIDPEALPYKILKITLQPLIENAVKHGVEKKLGDATIKLTVEKQGDEIEIRISDNGTGFDPDALEAFEAFKRQSASAFYEPGSANKVGLKNVYLRLRILFGDRLGFNIDSIEGEGADIAIRFPAIPAK